MRDKDEDNGGRIDVELVQCGVKRNKGGTIEVEVMKKCEEDQG
jgi:hypothetical protein